MKIRAGFVSNSSSSSFIVFKPVEKMEGTKEEVVKEFLSQDDYGFDTIEERLEDRYFKELYEKLIEATKNIDAFEILDASIEYGGEEDLQKLLDRLDIKYIRTE